MENTLFQMWSPLKDELQNWADNNQVATLWLRDDDAIEVRPALERLNDLCTEFDVPYTIAVIPDLVLPQLAHWTANHQLVDIAVHGFSHTNHAPSPEKKCELGLHRGKDVILDELAQGLMKLRALFGEQMCGLLVPPWNRIDQALVPHLTQLGFKGLSTYGWKPPQLLSSIKTLNTHVDIIDWKGTRGGVPSQTLVTDLVKALQTARMQSASPAPAVGILTHHFVHDEQAWAFLNELMTFCAMNDHITWKSAKEIAQL